MPDSISRRVFFRPGPRISGDAPIGYVGLAYNFAYTLAGGTPPLVVTVTSGAIPAGLSLSTAGVLTGTPTTEDLTPGSFTLLITDSALRTGGHTDAIEIARLGPPTVSGSLPDYYTGAAITPFDYTVTGDYTPLVCTILSGALPTGLSMDANGQVTGTPTTAGSYSWTVRVTDALLDTYDHPDSAVITASVLWDSTVGEFSSEADGTSVAEFQDADMAIYALFGTGSTEARIRAQSTEALTGKRYFEFDLAMNDDAASGRYYIGVHGDTQAAWPSLPDDYVILRPQNTDGTATIAVNAGGSTFTTGLLNWSGTDRGTCRIRMAVDVATRTVWFGVGVDGDWTSGDPETDTGGYVVDNTEPLYLYGDIRNITTAKQRRIEIVTPGEWTWTPPTGYA